MKTEDLIIKQAIEILATRASQGDVVSSPATAARLLQLKLAQYDREVFAVLFLNGQHAMIELREMFFGTIDGAAVYPREVARAALQVNAAAVIFAHNHPSDKTEPSQADIAITRRLSDALGLFDIRVLDHIVVGRNGITSFAERGLI